MNITNKLHPFILVFFVFALSSIVGAQDHDHEQDENNSTHLHEWEIGGAVGIVYNVHESHTAPGLHAHLLKNIGVEKRFGMGLGFETIIDEHQHFNFGIPLNYNTLKGFVFTITPGLLFKKETNWEPGASVHFETLYEFMFEHFHIGPMLEIALSQNEVHFMLGIHLGLGW